MGLWVPWLHLAFRDKVWFQFGDWDWQRCIGTPGKSLWALEYRTLDEWKQWEPKKELKVRSGPSTSLALSLPHEGMVGILEEPGAVLSWVRTHSPRASVQMQQVGVVAKVPCFQKASLVGGDWPGQGVLGPKKKNIRMSMESIACRST